MYAVLFIDQRIVLIIIMINKFYCLSGLWGMINILIIITIRICCQLKKKPTNTVFHSNLTLSNDSQGYQYNTFKKTLKNLGLPPVILWYLLIMPLAVLLVVVQVQVEDVRTRRSSTADAGAAKLTLTNSVVSHGLSSSTARNHWPKLSHHVIVSHFLVQYQLLK